MQDNSTVRSTEIKSSGCHLVIVTAFSPLKHYLNELGGKKKKKTWLGKKNSYICLLCVPGTWHSCWGFLLPAASCAVILQLLPFSDSTLASMVLSNFYFIGTGKLMKRCG